MADWSISYELIDKGENPSALISRTSKFRQRKWIRDPVADREVIVSGIDRTVPASERPKYKKLTAPDYHSPNPLKSIDPSVATHCEAILGTRISTFERTDIGGGLVFYVGGDQTRYSEFHFGAGESSVIRIVEEIESVSDSSLVLIEELENGLHPVAVRRLVEYLINVADRKRLQVLFTTHSDAALQPLPPQAIWASLNGSLQQGKLSIEALRAVSGRTDRELAIFVEDDFAASWVAAMIRSREALLLDRVGIYGLEGDGSAIKTHQAHGRNPSIVIKSICLIDGDSSQEIDEAGGIIRLPGSLKPEIVVFDGVRSDLSSAAALLTANLQLDPNTGQNSVVEAIEQLSLTNIDRHVIFSQLGIKLGFISETVVIGAFFTRWIAAHSADTDRIVDFIRAALQTDQA